LTAVGEGVAESGRATPSWRWAPFSLGTHVTTYYPLVAHKPKRLTFEEGATLPIAFLTADYA
jgi:NADPH:quinone reductase-like Zn-dependent oxidoreductase